MTALAGIVTFDGALPDIRTEDLIRSAISAPRKGSAYVRRLAGATFVQRTPAAPSHSQSTPPFAGSSDRFLFAADARLDNRPELGAALALSPSQLEQTPDSLLILRMHQRWGDAGIARCLGAFAFALWDAEARRLTFGRDCLGSRVLFFHRGDGFVAFATSLGALLAIPRVPRELDEVTLANFLAVNLTEPTHTFYRGVERVPTRTMVTVDRGAVGDRHYWSPDFDAPPPFRRDEDYIERARELFDQAVATATADLPHVAISTSGGLDSSAIAATVARLGRAESIACYTMVPPAGTQIEVASKYLDEHDKVDALARMHPALDVRFMSVEHAHPYEEDITRFFARANMPILGPTILEQHAHLENAITAAGHRTLLVGNYGNFGLTWHGRFSVLALLRFGEFGMFARELHATSRRDNRDLARTFVKEVAMPAVPVWARRLSQRLRGRDPDSVARYSSLNPDYVVESDLGHQWQAQGFDPWTSPGGWSPPRHRARFLFDLNQIGRDHRAMSEEWRRYEVRDPHADRRLLEFALTVPEPMYRRDGVPRSFARAVFADRLPREILDEQRRGALAVTWFRHLNARRQEIAAEVERLAASPLASRLIDLPRLRRLIEQWPEDENAAEKRRYEYTSVLGRGIHVGRFIRWVEGGNA
jgi:asparagine synthase (glutamine-hydrolysing)